MNHRPLALSTALALALATSGAAAMGLGPLQVKSGLNQPLVAEIPIVSATAAELDQLDVRLASAEAFARVGLERPGALTANLQFSIGENAAGQPVIRVTTPNRFNEPLLNFVIEANWGKGIVTREYAALIDPPYIAPAVVRPLATPAIAVAPPPPQPAVVEAAPVEEPASPPEPEPAPQPARALPVEPEPAPVVVEALPEPPRPVDPQPAPTPPPQVATPAPVPDPVAPAPAPAPPPAPAPAPAAPERYGPVAPGQTLWSIANATRPDASVSVNQMMLALLRANPGAFDADNVNRLRSGSVLRVPGQAEVAELSAAEAARLVRMQADAWRTPRAAVPQPVEAPAPAPAAAEPAPAVSSAPPRPAAAPSPAPARTPSRPARNTARLEIVPPSGDARARGAQSGAAAGAGGSELRAELVQAREDLAARNSEVTDLKSRLGELEQQQADRQRLIDLQNSQLKDLQDRLRQMEAERAAAPATAAAPPAAVAGAPAAEPAPVVAPPWYLNPFVLAGAALLFLGGLVLALRRGRGRPEPDVGGPRLSDDEALRASIARTREANAPIRVEPAATPPDPELLARQDAIGARPSDLEAHLNLLRLYHARGNAVDYEAAAQAMRSHVASTMDPRWREAVIMGASLMPGHALFSQAGWNVPRYDESHRNAPAEPTPAAPSLLQPVPPEAASPAAAPVRVFDAPPEDYDSALRHESPLIRAEPDLSELNLDDAGTVFGDVFGKPPTDIHRSEAELMVEDQSSATRIELAKAYLDIGDVDGARSMLEEVLIEGGPSAKAEAGRILRDLP